MSFRAKSCCSTSQWTYLLHRPTQTRASLHSYRDIYSLLVAYLRWRTWYILCTAGKSSVVPLCCRDPPLPECSNAREREPPIAASTECVCVCVTKDCKNSVRSIRVSHVCGIFYVHTAAHTCTSIWMGFCVFRACTAPLPLMMCVVLCVRVWGAPRALLQVCVVCGRWRCCMLSQVAHRPHGFMATAISQYVIGIRERWKRCNNNSNRSPMRTLWSDPFSELISVHSWIVVEK